METAPKHHNPDYRRKAIQWWRSLSINDWKALQVKHGLTFQHAGQTCYRSGITGLDITRMYDAEGDPAPVPALPIPALT